RQSGLPFAPICGGRLYLRNGVQGARSSKETVAEFLRDNVWFGEDIVRIVRETVYKDAFLESSETEEGAAEGDVRVVPALPGAAVGREARMAAFVGFDLEGGPSTRDMEIGLWYPVAGAPGIYASAFQPGEALIRGSTGRRGRSASARPRGWPALTACVRQHRLCLSAW
ncbi:MAG: hypothetical protein CVT80_17225, partial [Alphaproteobacteria bacterium HGW-Alphaproteobacteria-2]